MPSSCTLLFKPCRVNFALRKQVSVSGRPSGRMTAQARSEVSSLCHLISCGYVSVCCRILRDILSIAMCPLDSYFGCKNPTHDDVRWQFIFIQHVLGLKMEQVK